MLNIYYGRESVSKEKFLFDQIKSTGDAEEPSVLLLVPDQFTLQAEKDAFYYLDVKGLMNIEVISMSRLGFRVLSELGGNKQNYIDKYGRHMLLAKLIAEKAEELQIYKGLEQKTSFIEMANNLISEMKQFNTSPEALEEIIAGIEEDSLLKRKLEDIYLIYEAYEAGIAGKYIDTEDYINAFLPKISQSKLVSEKQIWVYGFDYFAPKNLEILKALMASTDVNVVLTYSQGTADEEIFTLTGGIINKLKHAAEEIGIAYAKIQIDSQYSWNTVGDSGHCLKAAALQVVEKNLYALPFDTMVAQEANDQVTLVKAANPYAEAETAAAYILSLVRDKGLRYRDILIICNDMQVRGSITRRIFEEYGIDLFLDQKRGILHNPAVGFVLSLTRMAAKGRRNEDVFKLLKTGLTDISQDNIEELENYVIKYRIKGNRWKQTFDKGVAEYGEEALAELNDIRMQIMQFITAFESGFKKVRTVDGRVHALYTFLTDTANLPEKLEQRIALLCEKGQQELADETAQIWDVIVNILDQLAALLTDEKISALSFADLLSAGIETVEIGLLPPTTDGILMGTMQRTRVGEIKALVVLGANDGLLPAEMQGDGLLNEDEKLILLEKGAELCKLDDLRVMEEQLAIYKTLSKPSNYLFMSYAISDAEGKELRPSSIFEKLRRIFPQISVKKDLLNREDDMELIQAKENTLKHMSKVLRDHIDGRELKDCWKIALLWYKKNDERAARLLSDGLAYSNRMDKLDQRTVKDLFQREGRELIALSPSALEKYSKCPFAYLINYGLRPDERRVFEMAAREIGDVYHSCLMKLSMELTEENVAVTAPASRWMNVAREAVDDIIRRLITEESGIYREGVLHYGKEEQYRAQRMEQICADMAWILIEHVRCGSIKEIAFEAGFGAADSRQFPPVEVQVGQEAILIEGKIDRVDILSNRKYRFLLDKKGCAEGPPSAALGGCSDCEAVAEGNLGFPSGSGEATFLDGDTVKIIDYKSGNEKFNADEAKAGWRLQLMLYLKAAQSNKADERKLKPAGVFYFNIDEPLIDASSMDQEELKEKISSKIRKEFKLDGVMVDEPNIIESIAGEFSEYSDIVPIRNTAQGIKGTSEGKLLNSEEFEQLQEVVDMKIQEICKSLLNGYIEAKPKKLKEVSACRYCKYKGICRFDVALDGCKYEII